MEDEFSSQPDTPVESQQHLIGQSTGLKIQPVYGVIAQWPDQPPPDWVHPDDLPIARRLIPSFRILKRTYVPDSEYYRYAYGEDGFRARGIMWLVIAHEGLDIGDRIEVGSQMGQSWPILGEVVEVEWNKIEQRIEYQIRRVDGDRQLLPQRYLVSQIQLVFDLDRVGAKRPNYQAPLSSVANPLSNQTGKPKFDGR